MDGEITDWQELNVTHRRARARDEDAIGQMKVWKILRDHQRAAHTLSDTASGIANLRTIAFIGQPSTRKPRPAKQQDHLQAIT